MVIQPTKAIPSFFLPYNPCSITVWRGNSTSTDKVARFKRLVPNSSWLASGMASGHQKLIPTQGRIQRVLLGGELWRARERQAYMRSGGLPQWGPGAKAKSLVRGQRDEVSLKLTRFCNFKFKFLMKNVPFLRNLNRIL